MAIARLHGGECTVPGYSARGRVGRLPTPEDNFTPASLNAARGKRHLSHVAHRTMSLLCALSFEFTACGEPVATVPAVDAPRTQAPVLSQVLHVEAAAPISPFVRTTAGWAGGGASYRVVVAAGGLSLRAGAGSVRFRTMAVGRGASAPVGPAEVAAEPDGVAFDRGTAVEHLAVTPAGVEQQWTFAAPPAGSGDLTVRVAAEGLTFAEADAAGLRLTDAAGGAWRYGAATWVDAHGRATSVPLAWAGGAVALTVPAAVLDATEWPAVLDPVISPEIAADAPTAAPGPTPVGRASAAFNGTVHLVAWTYPFT